MSVTVWLLALGAGVLGRRVRRRLRKHRPRALELALALPRPEPTLKEFVDHGWADWDGTCAWCGRLWTNCTAEILAVGRCKKMPIEAWWQRHRRQSKPIQLPVAGPGAPRLG